MLYRLRKILKDEVEIKILESKLNWINLEGREDFEEEWRQSNAIIFIFSYCYLSSSFNSH